MSILFAKFLSKNFFEGWMLSYWKEFSCYVWRWIQFWISC